MAKKSKRAKLNISSLSQETLATAARNEDEWQTKDDADKIRNYAKLRSDEGRHKKAMDHINNEHAAMRDIIFGESVNARPTGSTTRTKVRAGAGRKKSNRVGRSAARR